MSDTVDWTEAAPGVVYQRCTACDSRWYFRRSFCPRCGDSAPVVLQAEGLGHVHALSVVARAPCAALRPEVPYGIALVDADEGFRLMTRAAPGLRLGDRVRLRFILSAGALLPYCETTDHV